MDTRFTLWYSLTSSIRRVSATLSFLWFQITAIPLLYSRYLIHRSREDLFEPLKTWQSALASWTSPLPTHVLSTNNFETKFARNAGDTSAVGETFSPTGILEKEQDSCSAIISVVTRGCNAKDPRR